ncbi:uncharacterized protein LOC115324408 [Ixodes scapularis]|uniref:uncharacterized protein LOC115324408 n=1 Tax=Ixodes scapularis TaxID=6945 RepID=UPI001C38D3F2|nr:uncharacterized protein LOC115324408 [Ixodes scapularis]
MPPFFCVAENCGNDRINSDMLINKFLSDEKLCATSETMSVVSDAEPQDYIEWDEEPGSHLVPVKPELDYREEYREPISPVLPLTKHYTDVTRVTFHLITEPRSEENRERDITAAAVKTEPQDPREVGAEAVFAGTGHLYTPSYTSLEHKKGYKHSRTWLQPIS